MRRQPWLLLLLGLLLVCSEKGRVRSHDEPDFSWWPRLLHPQRPDTSAAAHGRSSRSTAFAGTHSPANSNTKETRPTDQPDNATSAQSTSAATPSSSPASASTGRPTTEPTPTTLLPTLPPPPPPCTYPADYNTSAELARAATEDSVLFDVSVVLVADGCSSQEPFHVLLCLATADHDGSLLDRCSNETLRGNASTFPVNFTGLTSCTSYDLVINATGVSVAPVQTHLKEPDPPKAKVSEPAALNRTLQLELAPADVQCPANITEWNVTWSRDGDAENSTRCSSHCTIVVGHFYTPYEVCASSLNVLPGSGETVQGDTSCTNVTMRAGNASCPGINVSSDSSSFNVSISPPKEPNGNLSYYAYGIQIENGPPEWNTTTDSFVHREGLSACQNISFQVRAVDNRSESFPIDGCLESIPFSTKSDVPPPVDLELSATNHSLTVNLSRPSDNFLCHIKEYQVSVVAQSNNVNWNYTSTQYKEGEHMFDSLHSWTEYNVQGWALTANGSGPVNSINIATLPAAPYQPSDVQLTECDRFRCNVTWSTALQLTGPTSFRVRLSLANDSEQHIQCDDQLSYYNRTLNATNGAASFHRTCDSLAPYTVYVAQVFADVTMDDVQWTNTSNYSEETRTAPDVPDPAHDVRLNCDASPTTATVRWSFEETKGKLEYFLVCYNQTRGEEPPSRPHCLRSSDGSATFLSLEFYPEYNYTLWVSAKNLGVEESSVSAAELCAKKARVPPKPSGSQLKALRDTIEHRSDNRVLFSLPRDFYSDVMGQIQRYVLFLYEDDIDDGAELDEGRVWRDVYAKPRIPPYRVTPINWNPFGKSTAVPDGPVPLSASPPSDDGMCCEHQEPAAVTCVLGCQRSCPDGSAESCNGRLRANTRYALVVRAYTSAGPTDSEKIAFDTGKPEPDGTGRAQVTLAVCLTFLVLFLVSAVFLHYRKRDIKTLLQLCPKRMPERPNTDMTIPPSLPITTRPIPLEEFAKHWQRMNADSAFQFSQEFEELKNASPTHPKTVAEHADNQKMNRWINILPFDHCRVKLLPSDESSSDYINASYIPGYHSAQEFIATQGPLPTTKDHFWRMVWEHSSQLVCMLTQCVERGRTKCECYWPEDKSVQYYGEVAVQMISEQAFDTHILRIFDLNLFQANASAGFASSEVDCPDSLSLLSNTDQGPRSLTVKQMHFTSWPDFDCPENARDLTDFVRAVREYLPRNNAAPIVVHCSAGVGRTGSFIAVDTLMHAIRANHATVDVYGTVLGMRNYRTNMVQTPEQYAFIHACVQDMLQPMARRDPSVSGDDSIYENVAAIRSKDTQTTGC